MIKHTSKLGSILIISLFLTVFLTGIFCTNVASLEQLLIHTTNTNGEEIFDVIEGNSFIVVVLNPYEDQNIYVTNVTIEFNNKIKKITIESDREVEFTAPKVDSDQKYTIKATKNTLQAEKTITVKNQYIKIEPSNHVVEAGKMFSVEVTDGKKPIKGARLAIQSYMQSQDIITDENGIAILKAPKDKEEITIIATYGEYSRTEITIAVDTEPSLFEKIINNEYLPVAFAVIILIGAIFFVNYRQKKAVYARAQEITKENRIEKFGLNKKYDNSNGNFSYPKNKGSNGEVRVNSKPESKVEEIRISRPKKQKEVVPIKTNEDKTKEILNKKKNEINKNNHDWFEGTDEVKYEIDKLTGKVDEEGLDKWFEGVEGLKEKIDKKVKKDKKKRDEEE